MIIHPIRRYLLVVIYSCLCFAHSTLFATYSDDLMQTFYKQPTYERFLACLQDAADIMADTTSGSSTDGKNALELSLVFLSQLQRKHPEFLAKAIASPPDLSEDSYSLLILTAIYADPSDPRILQVCEPKHAHNAPDIDYFSQDFRELTISQPADLDVPWACYAAAGEDTYVLRLLDHLSSKPLILIDALEIFSQGSLKEVLQTRCYPARRKTSSFTARM